jgi:hypothetical protein
MPKISKNAGASVAVPESAVHLVLQMKAEGKSLAAIALQLNQWAIVLPDRNGTPRPGLWTTAAVQDLIDANQGA